MITQEQREESYIQFCADVLITGIEGGIDFWVDSVRDYRWDCPAPEVQAYISWSHDSEYYEQAFINWETVNNGIKDLLKDADLTTIWGWEQTIAKAVINDDASQLDAIDADNLIQRGLFTEVQYA